MVLCGAGWLPPPWELGQGSALLWGLHHTCTPRPCIWITCARSIWIPLRMVFWCSASVIPRLRTSLQNEPRVTSNSKVP